MNAKKPSMQRDDERAQQRRVARQALVQRLDADVPAVAQHEARAEEREPDHRVARRLLHPQHRVVGEEAQRDVGEDHHRHRGEQRDDEASRLARRNRRSKVCIGVARCDSRAGRRILARRGPPPEATRAYNRREAVRPVRRLQRARGVQAAGPARAARRLLSGRARPVPIIGA